MGEIVLKNTIDGRRVWRRSALEAAACLYRYLKVYVEGVDEGSDANRRGRAFHRTSELYVKELIQQQTTADIDIARDSFLVGMRQELLPSHLIAETEKLVFDWAERFELDLDQVLTVEGKQVVEIGGELFECTMDLVYGTPHAVIIKDYKTHFAALTPEQAKREFQPNFYAVIAMHVWPGAPKYVFQFLYVRLGITVEVNFGPEDFDAAERRMLGAVAVIQEAEARNEWPAMPGPHCDFCRLDCPLNAKRGEIPVRVENDEHFARLASDYLVAKRHADQLKKILPSYCVAEGPQEAHGVRFELQSKTSRRYPVASVLEVAEHYGAELPDMAVPRAELAPFTDERRYPEMARDLELVSVDGGTTFEFTARRATLGEPPRKKKRRA